MSEINNKVLKLDSRINDSMMSGDALTRAEFREIRDDFRRLDQDERRELLDTLASKSGFEALHHALRKNHRHLKRGEKFGLNEAWSTYERRGGVVEATTIDTFKRDLEAMVSDNKGFGIWEMKTMMREASKLGGELAGQLKAALQSSLEDGKSIAHVNAYIAAQHERITALMTKPRLLEKVGLDPETAKPRDLRRALTDTEDRAALFESLSDLGNRAILEDYFQAFDDRPRFDEAALLSAVRSVLDAATPAADHVSGELADRATASRASAS